MKEYAESLNYFSTSVTPSKSQGEIMQLLEDFGATMTQVTQGTVNGNYGWLIKFGWMGRTYRFTFTPVTCKYPNKPGSYSGKRRTHVEQSKYQMGRIAVFFVKAILTAARAKPDALFGFMELESGKTTYESEVLLLEDVIDEEE